MLLEVQATTSGAVGHLIPFGIAAIVVGAGWFIHAFRSYGVERKVSNTPLSRCDALAVGKVALYGAAHGDRLFPALFSGIECIFSRAIIERWEGEGNKGSWVHVATIVHPPRPSFLLSDQSGSVAVLPAGADFRLRSTRYEHGDPLAQSGEDLLAMHDPSGTAHFRVDEMMLEQDASIYIYGFATQASMVPPEAQPLGGSIAADRLAVWNRPGNDFILADEAPQALAADLRRTFSLGMVGGPAAIAAGVAVLVWALCASSLMSKISFPFSAHSSAPGIVYLPNVNRQYLDGTTLLIRAARGGESERMEQLLRSGADPNIVDNQGRTALHYAVLARSELAVSALLRAQPQPLLNLQDDAGNTPLHLAVHLGDVVVIRELLAAGADASVPNLARQTPLDAARKSRGPDAAAIVLTLQNASHL
jgi:hypothetical protein